ncbi:hypothetical protein TIFTF001_017603 [Ficus carica]|uniref:Uncharacterized protein n=1 Tax=Ficus carica TaxID=3494 RepID=A0AA88AAY2_FICCA|nr:hypothetical protein TIFTF001_017603 [Ficus carica]
MEAGSELVVLVICTCKPEEEAEETCSERESVEVVTCICILVVAVVVIGSGNAPWAVAVSALEEAEAGTCSGRDEKQVGVIPWRVLIMKAEGVPILRVEGFGTAY